MDWNAAEAKAKFSELIERAQTEPQVVRNRGRKLAVVVSADEFERLSAAEAQQKLASRTGWADFIRFTEGLKARAGGDLTFELPQRDPAPHRNPFESEE